MIRPVPDERQRRILTFVVESHVSRAEPVGSQYVRAAYHLSISPATIRNSMQQLEEMGYLRHPHTSAGRIPTEAGYRYYVDELMRPEPVPAATRRVVTDALGPALEEEDAFSAEIPRLLARASRQLALVAVRGAAARLNANAVRVEGADNITAQPEFQSPARLRPLVSLLADREPLARALEATAEPGRARVSIGREIGSGAMRDCSLVGMRVELRGLQGFLGIMGPVRMPYRRLVALVSYVGERLSERR